MFRDIRFEATPLDQSKEEDLDSVKDILLKMGHKSLTPPVDTCISFFLPEATCSLSRRAGLRKPVLNFSTSHSMEGSPMAQFEPSPPHVAQKSAT